MPAVVAVQQLARAAVGVGQRHGHEVADLPAARLPHLPATPRASAPLSVAIRKSCGPGSPGLVRWSGRTSASKSRSGIDAELSASTVS